MSYRSLSAVFSPRDVEYFYLIPNGEPATVGDFILTSVGADRNDSRYIDLTCAKYARITQVLEYEHPRAKKFYLQLLRKERLEQRWLDNENLKVRSARKEEARIKLDRMLKEQNVMLQYRLLAERDPEAAKLLRIMEGSEE